VLTFGIAVGFCPLLARSQDRASEEVDFNRDIRPILSDRCFLCHGPDSASRQADLRLDRRNDATADRGGYRAVVPGNAAESDLYRRITTGDPQDHMPPLKSALKLTAAEIELLRRWIDQGAKFQPHWSFIPPKRPPVPEIRHSSGARNPVDHFIGKRLEAEGLEPAPAADKTTLIRRVTFDLTGLPPTPQEVDDFLADASPQAYERVVDRLLGSPRYGERMAVEWLNAARYADTNGYQSDEQRYMWRWRDWVIDAFNKNLPFDQFTVEQLAGDLLPSPRLDQIIATGFNRNHRANSEGGIIPEEFLVEYAVDRLDTTATVWLGLTIGCARCHDHKYDPITQKEFYRLLAFFNNVPEEGKVSRTGNARPVVKTPTPEIAAEIERADAALASAEETWRKMGPQLAAAQATWELSFDADDQDAIEGLVAQFNLDGNADNARGKHDEGKRHEGNFVGGPAAFVPGRMGQAARFEGDRFIDVGDVAAFGESDPFSYGAWIYPQGLDAMAILSRMDQDDSYVGYDLFLAENKVQADLVNRILDDSIRVETEQAVLPCRWQHVLVTYDGSRSAKGVRIYLDGSLAKVKVLSDTLSNPIKNSEPLRIGSRGTGSLFRGWIDDVRLYSRELSAEESATLASAESIAQIVAVPTAKRTPAQQQKVQSHFLAHHAPAPLQEAFARFKQLRKERDALEQRIPTTMIMQENPTRNPTFVLVRGEYDKPGEKVEPAVPASLPPLKTDGPVNRLALARWLVDPANPLVARVTVNRFWQMYFGTGLVKTPEDFGSQGETPRHPELLDWLATEFIRTGWDMKAMQKLLVMSATYQQSSKIPPQLLARDPDNRLLARGPRYRLSAEMIRDAALATSGLLVEKIGGPSVKPYQPPGLWEELGATAGKYPQEQGSNLYRRSMYTFWKRTIPPPSMMIFDASGREMCTVRQVRTNTPLQALTLLNDIPYVEASRALAERVLLSGARSADERLDLAFRMATARHLQPRELTILQAGLDRYLTQYRECPEAAQKLLGVGESPRNQQLDPVEHAAYTVTMSVILNLDETITKE
jgi:uncharacterized protein DUF1553/uncharacterized protein DUF1549/concanavalin A-like lectin/glucanase superfamily protein/cytochrome c